MKRAEERTLSKKNIETSEVTSVHEGTTSERASLEREVAASESFERAHLNLILFDENSAPKKIISSLQET